MQKTKNDIRCRCTKEVHINKCHTEVLMKNAPGFHGKVAKLNWLETVAVGGPWNVVFQSKLCQEEARCIAPKETKGLLRILWNARGALLVDGGLLAVNFPVMLLLSDLTQIIVEHS
jgi:hypothetical protein